MNFQTSKQCVVVHSNREPMEAYLGVKLTIYIKKKELHLLFPSNREDNLSKALYLNALDYCMVLPETKQLLRTRSGSHSLEFQDHDLQWQPVTAFLRIRLNAMDSDLLSTSSGRAGLKATLTLASEAVLRQVPCSPTH